MAQEKPSQTLQATALVHEAYVHLVDTDKAQHGNSRGHFLAAAVYGTYTEGLTTPDLVHTAAQLHSLA